MPHEAVKTISTGLQLFSNEFVPKNIYHHSDLSDSDRFRLVVSLFLLNSFTWDRGSLCLWALGEDCSVRAQARTLQREGRQAGGRAGSAGLPRL